MGSKELHVPAILSGYVNALESEARQPQGNDGRIGKIALAHRNLIVNNFYVADALAYTFELSRTIAERSRPYQRPTLEERPKYTVNKAVRATQKQVLRSQDPNYPHLYNDIEHFDQVFRKIFNSKDGFCEEEFLVDILTRNVQSNVARRYATLGLVFGLFFDRFGEGAKWADMGSGQVQGPKKQILKDKYPFQDIEVVKVSEDKKQLVLDPRLSYVFNKLVKAAPVPRLAVGVDAVSIRDQTNKEWARSCTFYPSELMDRARVKEYHDIETAEPSNVVFELADFMNTDRVEEIRQKYGQFNLVTFITSLYELSNDEQRELAIENAKKLLKSDGLLLIQDFIERVDEHTGKLVFAEDIYARKGLYKAYILDMLHPEEGYQELVTYITGRCDEAILNLEAIVRLGHSTVKKYFDIDFAKFK